MKIIPPTNNRPKVDKPPLPLIIEEEEELHKGNSDGFKLCSNPTNGNSPKHKVQVRIIDGTESLHVLIDWYKDVVKISTGLNTGDTGH